MLLDALKTHYNVFVVPIFIYFSLKLLADFPGLMKTGNENHEALESLLVDLCKGAIILAMSFLDLVQDWKFFFGYLRTSVEGVTERIFHHKSGQHLLGN